MLVRRVIEWILPPNKPGTSDIDIEESSQIFEDALEEVVIGNQSLKMEKNIYGNSSRQFVDKKNEGNAILELKDDDGYLARKVGAWGDCDNELRRAPKLSPLCMRILQKTEDKRTMRSIFTQTDNNRRRGKVTMNASDTRHSSSTSRIDLINRMEDVRRSCENLKESFWCDDIKKHAIKEDFPNDMKRVDFAPTQTEEIPYKNNFKEKKKINIYVEGLKRFSSEVKKGEDSIIPTRVATLLRDSAEEFHHKELDSDVYGELLVLGAGDGTSRVSSRFVLRKRQKACGVKEMCSATYIQPLPICKHTVSFQVSASRSVVVEYVRDTATDMFQMGRHEHPPIDIRLPNVNNGRKGLSRFACRLVVQRHGHPRQVRLYAAAFDASGNIFLGEEAVARVCPGGDMDGFTTNGVHLLYPGGEWREVSVRGGLYPARLPGESAATRRPVQEEENLLLDGTLIDLCGVTLLWRTREGLMEAPDEDCLDRMDCLLKELAPQCQRRNGPPTGELHYCGDGESRTFVFLSCGHVVSMAVQLKGTMKGWSCPECRCIGSVACLQIGRERGFYADKDLPTHAFRPCGHVTTLRTVRHWSSIAMPPHRNAQEKGICPFCATKLHPVNKYVKLIYPTEGIKGGYKREIFL